MEKLSGEKQSAFFKSEELAELTERLKTADNLLEIFNLRETQHSAVMAWMFNPKEGHGQGEEILRDLLMHASSTAQLQRLAQPHDPELDANQYKFLEKSSPTHKFFEKWSVTRLKTAALGACFVTTEYAEEKENRFDLLVIDPVNQFMVVIENKAGAKLTDQQLERYRKCTLDLKQREWIKNFDVAFIALDRDYEEEFEDGEDQPTPNQTLQQDSKLSSELKQWLVLNYGWLQAGANRASRHIQRGNAAARLIENYCQQQSAWASQADGETLNLAARLWEAHPEVVAYLCERKLTGSPEKSWIQRCARHIEGAKDTAENIDEDILLFSAQNRSIIQALSEAKGFAAIKWRIEKDNPSLLGLVKPTIKSIRVPLTACKQWPLFLTGRESRKEKGQVVIRLVWNSRLMSLELQEDVKQAARQAIVKALKSEGALKTLLDVGIDKNIGEELEKQGASQIKRVVLKRDSAKVNVASDLLKYEAAISKALSGVFDKKISLH